ncbi:MAG: signal peptidase I [Anaerovoracaceae bacterium]|nr:signal peptidase I [Anaerovoracaceae bacterium]
MQQSVTSRKYNKLIRRRPRTRNIVFAAIAAIALVILLMALLMPVYRVYGDAMAPTLHSNDIVMSTGSRGVSRGDMVAFYFDNKLLIRRVIGVGGDKVEVDSYGKVYVNGDSIREPYIEKGTAKITAKMPCKVPDGSFFVMCDNRENGQDSRNAGVGTIKKKEISGKIVLRIWPPGDMGIFHKG